MATTELPRYTPVEATESRDANFPPGASAARSLISPLASLRLTVVLLSLSLVLVLAGTLAQIDYDVWRVVHDYFRTWVAWIELKIFFPRAWEWPAGIVFPFPGGKLIGVALAINLIAAHAVRFKFAARGMRLVLGVVLIALGSAITYFVIASGSNKAIESELSASFANTLWHLLRAAIGGVALGLAYVLALSRRTARVSASRWLWRVGAVAAVVLLGLTAYLFLNPHVRLDASGLRILWQLAKAGGASVVLGLGCWLAFARRAGIVLLHGGIGLLMLSELYTAERAVEAQMRIVEGQEMNYAEDIRSFEVAVAENVGENIDRVTTIPGTLIAESARSKQAISLADLPFDVRVLAHLPNASVRYLQPGETSAGGVAANAGRGQLRTADELPANTGVAAEQSTDMPATYVELVSKAGGQSLGVYLLRPYLADEAVEADGRRFALASRFKRVPKSYSIELKEFRFEKYEGTETPKNFESIVQFRDPAHHVDMQLSTSMNNPIRYGGDTIYQASYDPENPDLTVLQIVTNAGWMIPYVSCVIVGAGMLIHFGQGIVRFVRRREEESWRNAPEAVGTGPSRPGLRGRWREPQVWAPALLVAVFGAWVLSRAVPPRDSAVEMNIHAFGALPVAYGGRTQPIDSLAANTLRTISGRETYEDARYDQRQPAIRWLLDTVAMAKGFRDHKVIRIENLEVLQALGLKARPGFRYSIAELLTNPGEFERQAKLASEAPEDERSLTQSKFLELDRKVRMIMVLMDAFGEPEIAGDTQQEVLQSLQAVVARIESLNRVAPRPVPPPTPQARWQTMMEAETRGLLAAASPEGRQSQDQAPIVLRRALAAYREGKAQAFNAATAEYRQIVRERAAAERTYEDSLVAKGERSSRKPAERLSLDRVAFEAYINHFSPFVLCIALYIAAFVLAAAAWLGWFEGFNRAANWLLWTTFALHTFGLISRVYISGRPPITNLYSSAVFIGWAGVLFALVFESVYRLGVGNLLAAALGFPTMLIAYYLTFDGDGDTIGVMQAVLDTNFWLATHVVCITLGYSTTFLAGALGLAYLLLGDVGGLLGAKERQQLARMAYGAVCFAIFFSFIGTVLGGLWADDSWGRFWGWDPKENGALMIVLWNAIVLHARWGKMVGDRGLAALAVLGNIVVAWSWFGVNQMGVGLHAYGFTEGRTFWVAAFMVTQLAVVALAHGVRQWRAAAPAIAS
ncbi:MAG: hypothetical protein DCC67_12870 [Planctomycetota bacterium]|nr:MAG: hypothetical protein DCC67_12870 [Planctomycetota bacterium]